MSPTRRELLRMRWVVPEGPAPGEAREQGPTLPPLVAGCSAERALDEAPPPWATGAQAPLPGGPRG
ncbi:hypothetical protein L6R53_09155 [Myxococcota bacterium]|nr:hypothetical protein [Myxococcota bacterium]